MVTYFLTFAYLSSEGSSLEQARESTRVLSSGIVTEIVKFRDGTSGNWTYVIDTPVSRYTSIRAWVPQETLNNRNKVQV